MMVLFFLAKDYRKMGYWESPLYRISRVFNEGDPTRIENWKSSISVIQENYLMGTGVGDEIDELQKKRNPETYVYQEKLNTHNQFLAEFVRTGIIGIILLIYMLIYMFRKSYKNPISIMFVIFMTVCFFTENIIDRQRGIVFFLLISELLFLETKYKSNTFAKNFSRLT
jgi:O-antigen ligase